MAEEKKAETDSATQAGGGFPNKLSLILTAANIVLTLGMAGALFVSFQKEKKTDSVSDIVVDEHASGEHGGGEKAAEGGHGGGHGEAAKADAHGAPAKHQTAHDFGKMVTLEQFTINLSSIGSAASKFVRVNIAVEVAASDTEAEMTQKMPQVRNAIIDLFNSKRPSDVVTPEGKIFLKDEIRNALNSFLVTGKVKNVFFTNFTLGT